MIRVFHLPDLGEGLTESEIVAWHVAPGDRVELNQHIADVETAKAVVELPSPFTGVIAELHQEPGVVVHVGEPIVSFEVPDDAESATPGEGVGEGTGAVGQVDTDLTQHADGGDSASGTASPPTREAVLVGYGAAAEPDGHPRRRPRTSPHRPADVTAHSAEVAPVPAGAGERPRSSPPVRALARELGIDLAGVTGTGPGGRITRRDVEQFQKPAAAAGRELRTPIKGVRKLTAAAMVQSAFTAPHVTVFLTVDVTPTMDLLDLLKQNPALSPARIGILAVVAKALCLAVSRNPSLNSRWDEDTGEIVQFGYVNLGVAAATPRGLIVPTIKGAQSLDLAGLAAALAELSESARAGTTSQAALAGGTISITNIGVFGVDAGTPILNPGEAAILALGAVRRQPWEYRGGVALRSVVTLSLSVDHRVVDGEQASKFLVDLGTILSEPGMVLAMV